jgi:HAD superfamily hydrolase (TIGR01509 family)
MKLKIPEGNFRAYLFDCDGTVVDSMPLHYIAWIEALREWHCSFDEELFYSWGGMPPVEIVANLNKMQGLKMPAEAVAERKEHLYYEQLSQLKPVPEVLEYIEAMHGRIPFAIVSGSSRESVIRSLTAVHLLDRFPIIVGSEDYQQSKPAPDAFLVGATRLGVSPKDCLVFEDTAMGIQAATSAGMASVRVPPPLERRNGTRSVPTA